MRSRVIIAALVVAPLLAAPCQQGIILAQSTPLPQVTHPRETRMSIKARQLQQKLAADIERAKAKGGDVAAAEKNKSDGDAALNAGHLRIAVQDYEAGEKALPKE